MSGRTLKLSLDDEAVAVLEQLRQESGHTHLAEVLRDALGVYNSLRELKRERPDWVFAMVNREAGELQELHIPTLARAYAKETP
jgi:hypothetical protein